MRGLTLAVGALLLLSACGDSSSDPDADAIYYANHVLKMNLGDADKDKVGGCIHEVMQKYAGTSDERFKQAAYHLEDDITTYRKTGAKNSDNQIEFFEEQIVMTAVQNCPGVKETR